MPSQAHTFPDLSQLASHIRAKGNKYTLLFAYNGKGKTRLCMEFKELGKQAGAADTLYFNAFTEDLFSWHNDLDGDAERYLKMETRSRFFHGLEELDIANKVRTLLRRYATFNFQIDFTEAKIIFIRETLKDGVLKNDENIKISRGEEMIFYWCFFLAIAQLAIEREGTYDWVKYIYVDDPISSLDDNNAIAVAHHLATLLKTEGSQVKAVLSTHHALFFNVLCNEMKNGRKLFLHRSNDGFVVKETNDTPFIYHIALVQELKKAIDTNQLYTYHFSLLRGILEKAANFHGFAGFQDCLTVDDDEDGALHARMVNILNHGGYSLFEPVEMLDENKEHFKQIFNNFRANYKFNPELFAEAELQAVPLG